MTAGTICVIANTRLGEVAVPVDDVVGLDTHDGGQVADTTIIDPNRLLGHHGEDRRR
jgi:hypothetical protein